MKIYTKGGDTGTTSLVGGQRVPKTNCRVESYGTVDELAAQTAYFRDNVVARQELTDELAEEKDELLWILDRLMAVAALLASDEQSAGKMPQIQTADLDKLEQAIDRITAEIPAVNRFTLPCGDPLLSLCHIVRTVCRRAERTAVQVSQECGVAPEVLTFLNRLSDYLYVLGRLIAMKLEVPEILWQGKR